MAERSYKIVFFLQPDVEGSHVLGKALQEQFNLHAGKEENLLCDYVSHKITKDQKSLELKLYIVYDVEKCEAIRPLYFRDVDVCVIVFDISKGTAAVEKIVEGLNLHGSDRVTVFFGYRVNDDELCHEIFDFIASSQGIYFEFSNITDVKDITEYLSHIINYKDRVQK